MLAIVGGFAVGYAPALAAAFGSRLSAPMGRMDLQGLRGASRVLITSVAPIVLGFRAPSTEWLPVSPWLGLALVVVAAASYAALRSSSLPRFFHVLLIVVPVVFIASGSFVDAQSYRYLMPVFGALPIVLAVGIDALVRRSSALGVAALLILLGLFGVQQVLWYGRLAADTRSAAALDCLNQQAVKGAFADYWLSYKLTFLTGERIVVSPFGFGDRYPPFSSYVTSLGVSPETEPCRSLLLK
jgi:hypothetical protein